MFFAGVQCEGQWFGEVEAYNVPSIKMSVVLFASFILSLPSQGVWWTSHVTATMMRIVRPRCFKGKMTKSHGEFGESQ